VVVSGRAGFAITVIIADVSVMVVMVVMAS
jgi:hypothetical protein